MSASILQLSILYDNVSQAERLQPGWGFSAFIDYGDQRILFDTGADKQILAQNMDQMGVDPETIDQVVLSHRHCDHVGGLSKVLDNMDDGTVFVPEGFPKHIIRKITSRGPILVTVGEATEIGKHAYSTGSLNLQYRGMELSEQGIVLESDEGPALIAGCAHPGVAKMIEKGGEILGDHFRLVLGGFHLYNDSPEEIQTLGQKLRPQVDKICPCHCSGSEAQKIFAEIWGEDYLNGGVGMKTELQV